MTTSVFSINMEMLIKLAMIASGYFHKCYGTCNITVVLINANYPVDLYLNNLIKVHENKKHLD